MRFISVDVLYSIESIYRLHYRLCSIVYAIDYTTKVEPFIVQVCRKVDLVAYSVHSIILHTDKKDKTI